MNSTTATADVARANDGPVQAVWCGYDVVLTGGDDRRAGPTDECKEPDEGKRAAARGVGRESRRFVRRESSTETHGWLRELDLRSDAPSIDEIRDWSFDVLEFEGEVLVHVFLEMLTYYDLIETFGLNRDVLALYCRMVMAGHRRDCRYRRVEEEHDGTEELEQQLEDSKQSEHLEEIKRSGSDPIGPEEEEELCEYHNWYHAVSCAHVSFLFLSLGGADAFLPPLERFCIIMGALIHDLDHPGTNNDFEVKRGTPLAKLYDDDAVLERHAISKGLKLCRDNPEADWLGAFGEERSGGDRERVERFVQNSVLATDPVRHAEILNEALAHVEKGPRIFTSSSSPTYFNRNDPNHRLFLGRLILHAADISNPLQSSFDVASDWAVRVTAEFSRQAAEEKRLALPVTAFMDGLDDRVKIAKAQIGFFGFMVRPLFRTFGTLFPNLAKLEGWGERNCDKYRCVINEHDKGRDGAAR